MKIDWRAAGIATATMLAILGYAGLILWLGPYAFIALGGGFLVGFWYCLYRAWVRHG